MLMGRVMHKRLFPRENLFTYGIHYYSCPLKDFAAMNTGIWFGVERAAIMSARAIDHGSRDGLPLETWARRILAAHGLNETVSDITLVAMPRVFGYVFNPVSFWFCRGKNEDIHAVLCEVNNTFGETHTYICAHEDARPITADDVMTARKVFHVSPFLEREGQYTFRFAVKGDQLGIFIDFHDADGRKQLLTSLTGRLAAWSRATVIQAFLSHPLVTLAAIARIHWQAVKLALKGIRFIPKPDQLTERLTRAGKLTNL